MRSCSGRGAIGKRVRATAAGRTRISDPPTPDTFDARKFRTSSRRRKYARKRGLMTGVGKNGIHSVDAILGRSECDPTTQTRLILGLILQSRTVPVSTVCL